MASFLLIAGAKTLQSEELVRLAEELAPGRVKFLFDRPREEMPSIYRSMDVFLLTSMFEMMPIALLEALASGLPVVVNRHPVLEWMAGTIGEAACRGGEAIDMSQTGRLAGFLDTVTPEWISAHGAGARQQAVQNFAKPVVIRQYIEYYRQVMAAGGSEQ